MRGDVGIFPTDGVKNDYLYYTKNAHPSGKVTLTEGYQIDFAAKLLSSISALA